MNSKGETLLNRVIAETGTNLAPDAINRTVATERLYLNEDGDIVKADNESAAYLLVSPGMILPASLAAELGAATGSENDTETTGENAGKPKRGRPAADGATPVPALSFNAPPEAQSASKPFASVISEG